MYKTEDYKYLIYLRGDNIVWEKNKKKVPFYLRFDFDKVSFDIYIDSLKIIIDLISSSKYISISFSSFNDSKGSVFEKYIFDDYMLNYSETKEKTTLLVEKSKKIERGVREIDRSKLIGLIKEKFMI